MRYFQAVIRSFLSLLFVVCLSKSIAQTDTEFWFAAPEVSVGSSLFDKPIYLRISTTQQESKVTISQPANLAFIPIVVEIPSNHTETIDLTGYIDIIENKPANKVLNYGLLITASSPVSVYYDVASTNCNCNPEIFSLKGKNALGTFFYTPFQNLWDNSIQVSYTPTPYSSFDIVATENNTIVTITPKNDLVGHPAGVSFSIMLNRGQTYSATALSQLASKHVSGSKVSADKPIAVTIKDDLLYHSSSTASMLGIDLVGDQIVPTTIIGNEYIIQKGLIYTDEKAFVLATQDLTAIYINGNSSPISTINAGETFTLTLSNESTYVRSSKPVYVYHISGFEYELGAALLPKIECNGSRQVGFTRSNTQVFALNLVVKTGGEGGFVLNGNPNLISANLFSVVPGTNGEWLAAKIKFNTVDVPVGKANIISNNKSIFQMGLIDGNDGGASYGYFSDFTALNLGNDKNICGGTVTLDAGIGKDSYLWSNGSTNQTITVSQSGTYWVKASINNCMLTDSIVITNSAVQVDLGPDVLLCPGQKKTLQAGNPGSTYKWQDGSISATFEVNAEGTYWVEVTTPCGTVRDEIKIAYQDLSGVNLGQDQILCTGQEFILDATFSNASYLWQDGSTSSTFLVSKPGTYSVEVTVGSCTLKDEINIVYMDVITVDLGNDTTLCEGQVKVLSAYYPKATYLWQDGSTKATFDVKKEGSYWVEVTNACNTIRDEIQIKYTPSPRFTLGGDTSFCIGSELLLNAFIPNARYRWSDGSTTSTYTVSEAGTYWVSVSINNCTRTDTITVQAVECPESLYIPNVFTPNGDKSNDTFYVKGIQLGKWQMEVFNRWGKIVYHSPAYYNNWNGEGVSNGIYFYLLKDPTTNIYYRGWVHIFR